MTKLINPNMHIFIDSDGVCMDFNKHYLDTHGVKHSSVKEEVMWANIEKDPDYFFNMPLMVDALVLWDYFSKYNPTVLTGCPKTGTEQAADAKRRAWAKEFGVSVPVITCFSRDKALHIKNSGDLLIDDFKKNCVRWIAAGGEAIQHRSAERTIREFEERFLEV